MKIECPKCKASLRVDESKIPEKGVYAKCPKCQARILVNKDVGRQKKDLETELKEPIGHEKEIERDTPTKKDLTAGGKTAIMAVDTGTSSSTHTCPKCATSVSSAAKVCPSCKFPIADFDENRRTAKFTKMEQIPYRESDINEALLHPLKRDDV